MLTFVRKLELINATWDEIDLDRGEWVIPAERMKMDKPHIVPLSRQVTDYIDGLCAGADVTPVRKRAA